MEPTPVFRRFRAPQRDGQTLVDPPRAELPGIFEQSRARAGTVEYSVQGRPLAELATSARISLLEKAIAYTSAYRGIPRAALDAVAQAQRAGEPAPLLLSGHQPQLFHPGVWYKNFVLGRLADEVGAVGVHLVIDSDLCRGVSIRVPTGSIDVPRVEAVAFDAPGPEVPYEERAVRDEATFSSFAARVRNTIAPFVEKPIIEPLWEITRSRCGEEANLGLRLAQGRHALEETWHNNTLELPQSSVCELAEFYWFVAHLLAELPRLWSAHNEALRQYRLAHHLRNRAHPVPDLGESNGWLEAPFWMWTSADPVRRPLYARSLGSEIEISDLHGHRATLPLSDDSDGGAAAEALAALAAGGWKIRTRALTTTLFARLVLGDLFLHGIGGAKYDQVTDLMAAEFFGFPLPPFAAVSATLRLPIATEREPASSPGSDLAAELRKLDYHPERFLLGNGAAWSPSLEDRRAAEELIARKREWIDTPKSPANARERHLAITEANRSLQPFVEPLRRRVAERLAEVEVRRRADAILRSREYAFCLFPREELDRLLAGDSDPPVLDVRKSNPYAY